MRIFFYFHVDWKKTFDHVFCGQQHKNLLMFFFLNWHCVVNKRCFLKTIKINWFGHHFLVKNAFRSNYKNQCALFKNKYIYFRSNISRFKSLHIFSNVLMYCETKSSILIILMPIQEEQYYNYYNTTNMKSRPIVEVVDSRIKY